jgi:hypothetical protein
MKNKRTARANLQSSDVYKPNGDLNIQNYGDSPDGLIARLVKRGFDNETIARKTFNGDVTRPSKFLKRYLQRIAAIRAQIESA